jgi:hypothetical protein
MIPLGSGPVCGDPSGGDVRLQTDDNLDLGEWNPDLAKRRHQASPLQLTDLVRAIARIRVDAGRRQKAELVVETKRLLRQPGLPGELTDAHQFHGRLPGSGRMPGDINCAASPKVRVKPGGGWSLNPSCLVRRLFQGAGSQLPHAE